MNPKVSIIVPVYNVEQYIGDCLSSIKKQDYENLEVILVDDGSTDRSGIICDEFCKEYDKAHIIHQKNQGLAEARNVGTNFSTGDYILFIDSDDYVAADCVSYLMNMLLSSSTEIATALHSHDINENIDVNNENYEERICTGAVAIEKACLGWEIESSVCGTIYKRKIVLNNQFPKGKLYEDVFVMFNMLEVASAVSYSNRKIYCYRKHEDSITTSSFRKQKMDALDAGQYVYDYVAKKYPEYIDSASVRCTILCWAVVVTLPHNIEGQKIFKEIRNRFINQIESTIKNRTIFKAVRIKGLLLYFGFWPTMVALSLRKNNG